MNRVPVNIAPVVYCAAISEGTAQDWDFLWDKYKKADVAAEQVVILNALGCTKDPKLLKKYLDLIYSNEVRLQDKAAAFGSTLTHKENADYVFEYLTNNFMAINSS